MVGGIAQLSFTTRIAFSMDGCRVKAIVSKEHTVCAISRNIQSFRYLLYAQSSCKGLKEKIGLRLWGEYITYCKQTSPNNRDTFFAARHAQLTWE